MYMFKSWCARDVEEENDGEAHQRTSQACRRRGAQPRTISQQYKARLRPPSRPRRSKEPQCPSRARTQDASQEEHSTALSQLASRIPAVAKPGAGAGRLDLEPDQQVADDSSVSSQTHREVVTGDRPDQNVRIKDNVGRSQTVMLRDDAEFKTKGKIARHSQTAATRRRSQKVSIRSETRSLRVAQCCSACAG